MNRTEINIVQANLLVDLNNLGQNRECPYQYHIIQTKLKGKLHLLWALDILDGDQYTHLLNMLDNIPSNIKEIIDDMF